MTQRRNADPGAAPTERRERSLSVPLRLIADGRLEWSATVPASALLAPESPDTLRIADVEVPRDSSVGVALALELIGGGLTVVGEITAAWTGPCARCWLQLDGEVQTAVREVFTAEPREGEQYRLDPEHADLTPMVREAVLLELPIEAVPCPHPEPCPNLPPELAGPPQGEAPPVDPRWAALEALRIPPDEPS